ncbi:MAG: glycosyltransferase family 2 protein [Planctomycetota bacterium]
MNRLSISVALPVYNEAETILEIIRQVKAVDREKEIIVVDDGSTDGTRELLEPLRTDPEIRIIFHEHNQGKGSSLRTAISAATKDVVIIQDADLEYDPQDYLALLAPLESGRADVVYGSRYLHGIRRVQSFWHTFGNKVLTAFSNLLTDLGLTDMETCYKVFRREIIQNIELTSNRFGFEPEITAKLAKLRCTIYEVPIHYWGRWYGHGKKITWKDGLAALFHILRYNLSRKAFLKDEAVVRSVLVRPPHLTPGPRPPSQVPLL